MSLLFQRSQSKFYNMSCAKSNKHPIEIMNYALNNRFWCSQFGDPIRNSVFDPI